MDRGTATATLQTPTVSARSLGMLSRREMAELGQLPLNVVNKAIEQEVIDVVRGPRREAAIPVSELAALILLQRIGFPLPSDTKRDLRDRLITFLRRRRRKPAELELSPAVRVRVDPDLLGLVEAAENYTRLRNEYIEIDPEVKGGVPVIKGTRLTASAVAARLAGGDTLEDLTEDYPYIEPEAFRAAEIYARAHPRRGRPPRPKPRRP